MGKNFLDPTLVRQGKVQIFKPLVDTEGAGFEGYFLVVLFEKLEHAGLWMLVVFILMNAVYLSLKPELGGKTYDDVGIEIRHQHSIVKKLDWIYTLKERLQVLDLWS